MDPAAESLLRALYRNLDQRELKPVDPRYVPLHESAEAFGPDVVAELTRGISWSDSGSLFFLSGHRGAGKSTQLLRLKQDLEEQGFAAVRLESEDYLNLRQPVDVVEFLFFLVGGITDAVEASGFLPATSATSRGWNRLQTWLQALPGRIHVSPSAEIEVGHALPGVAFGVNLKAELRNDDSFVAHLRTFLEGRLSELKDEANRIVQELVEELRDSWPARTGRDWKGLVVLVDSLDHVRGADFREVRRALVDLFDKQASTVTLDACRSVFIVPPWTHIDQAPIYKITNIKVSNPEGREVLRQVVERRVPEGGIEGFIEREHLEGLILDSGGHLRDLLRLIRGASVATDRLPFDDRAILRGRQEVRDGMLPLAADEISCLRHVRERHALPLTNQDAWDALSGLFDRHLILAYKNGETWYDVHPLIVEEDLAGE